MRRFVDQVEDEGIAVPEGGVARSTAGFVLPKFRGVGLDLGLSQPEGRSLLGMGEEMERFSELDLTKEACVRVVETHQGGGE